MITLTYKIMPHLQSPRIMSDLDRFDPGFLTVVYHEGKKIHITTRLHKDSKTLRMAAKQ